MRIHRFSLISLGMIVGFIGIGCAALGFRKDPYQPKIDPANFQTTVDNPFYPLVPGTKLKYIEKAGRETRENLIEMTNDTRTIAGVKCVVVHDTVLEDGKLKEDTFDWFAQDKQGTVWYFGEDTKEYLPNGKVSTKGSWEAQVKGAQPGIIMTAEPKPGDPYYQEYYAGEAEDMAQIIALGDKITVPAGTFDGCIRTKEWSMLESGSEKKWYARGIGIVRTEATDGEVAQLVSITRP